MSIIAGSPFDMRQYCIERPSGFLRVGPAKWRPDYQPSTKTLTWPNGCKALLFSAEDPETLRGASGSFFWWDELAKSRYVAEGWPNMLFGLREGNPRASGLSPRMRGNLRNERRKKIAERSIPTHAGKPARQTPSACSRWVYPHACGETRSAGSNRMQSMGLSPRMRGNRRPCCIFIPSIRSIPTHAGKPIGRSRIAPARRVYPHACGET